MGIRTKDSKRLGTYNGRARSYVRWFVTESRPWSEIYPGQARKEKNEAFRRKHEDPLFAIMTNKEAKRREILSNPIVMEKLRQEHAEKERKRKEAKILK